MRFSPFGDAEFQIFQQSITEAVNPSMNCQRLTALPGVVSDGSAGDVASLVQHIQLAKPVQGPCLAVEDIELHAVAFLSVLDVAKPVVDQAGGSARRAAAMPPQP